MKRKFTFEEQMRSDYGHLVIHYDVEFRIIHLMTMKEYSECTEFHIREICNIPTITK